MKKNQGNKKETPAPSVKKDGITSAFSAATGDSGKNTHEGMDEKPETAEHDNDKVAEHINDEPAGGG